MTDFPRLEALRIAEQAAHLAADLVARVSARNPAEHEIVVAIACQIRGAANRLREMKEAEWA